MRWIWQVMRGGILQSRRAETLGLAAGLAGLIKALAAWAAGDLSVLGLARAITENWPLIAAGLGLATLGAKLERKQAAPQSRGEPVSDIAAKAVRR
jgi:hypothetical protein